jgi:hypothetical protein
MMGPGNNQKTPKKTKNKISACAVLEGRNEKWYLEKLKSLKILQPNLVLKPNGTKTNAKRIVDKAIKLLSKSSNIEDATVYYVVFDVDNESPKVFEDLDKQLKDYKDKIIPILSNLKIEYVLYSHFHYSDAQECYEKKLKSLKDIPQYEKSEKEFNQFCSVLTQNHVKQMQENLKQRDKDLSLNADTLLRDRACKNNLPNSNFYVLIDALTNQKT